MKFNRPLIIGIGIIAVIAAGVAFLRKPAVTIQQAEAPKPIAVGTRSVADSRSATLNLSFPGTVSTEGIATISAKTAGIVSSTVRLGQQVGVGTVLARIDDPSGSVVSTSGFRNADVRAAELAVERADLSYTDSKRVDRNASSNASELGKELARKNLESAQAALTALLDLHTVKSPISGTVTESSVATGDSVNAGTALFTVKNGSSARSVTFYVSESERALLVPGQKVTVLRSAGDAEPIEGALRQVSSVADPASRRFLAEATLPEKTTVSPGTSVSVSTDAKLVSSATDQIFLPLSAVAVESSGTFAIFQNVDGIAKRVEVRIVRIEGEIALVSSDLQNDAEIIIENAKRVKDGDSIDATKSEVRL